MSRTIWLFAAATILSMGPMVSGCSSNQQQTKTVEQTTTDANGQPVQTTTTTTTDKSDKPDSVVGATAHAIGTVILFPFRLIGDAVELIV